MSRARRQTAAQAAAQAEAVARFLGRTPYVPVSAPVRAPVPVPVQAPVRAPVRSPYEARVPAGHYATDGPAGTRFFRVGYSRVERWLSIWELKGTPVRTVADMNRERLTYGPTVAAFDEIARDPDASRMRFSAELGVCRRCGALLTNELSRERGYGPECWKEAA